MCDADCILNLHECEWRNYFKFVWLSKCIVSKSWNSSIFVICVYLATWLNVCLHGGKLRCQTLCPNFPFSFFIPAPVIGTIYIWHSILLLENSAWANTGKVGAKQNLFHSLLTQFSADQYVIFFMALEQIDVSSVMSIIFVLFLISEHGIIEYKLKQKWHIARMKDSRWTKAAHSCNQGEGRDQEDYQADGKTTLQGRREPPGSGKQQTEDNGRHWWRATCCSGWTKPRRKAKEQIDMKITMLFQSHSFFFYSREVTDTLLVTSKRCNSGFGWKICELLSSVCGVLIITVELFCLIPVWMTLPFI